MGATGFCKVALVIKMKKVWTMPNVEVEIQ